MKMPKIVLEGLHLKSGRRMKRMAQSSRHHQVLLLLLQFRTGTIIADGRRRLLIGLATVAVLRLPLPMHRTGALAATGAGRVG